MQFQQAFMWARMDDIIIVKIRIEKMILHMSESFILKTNVGRSGNGLRCFCISIMLPLLSTFVFKIKLSGMCKIIFSILIFQQAS